MNQRNYLMIGFAIGLVLLLAFLFWPNGSGKEKQGKGEETTTEEFRNQGDISREIGRNFMGNYTSIFDQGGGIPDSNEFFDSLKTGKMNFIWELWALRDKCPPDSTIHQCNSLILAMIDEKINPPGNEDVKKLFIQYFEYEAELVKKSPKEGAFEDRYEDLKKFRREHFKDEEALLVFGMEEAQVDFIKESKEFIDKSEKMSGDERVKRYEEIKKKAYGSFYESMVSREEKFDHYQNEIMLREKELANLGPEQKDSKLRSLQEKYFGKEGAERIAQVQKEESEYRKKLEDFDKKEASFLKENTGLKPEELQKKLTEFRVQNLGAEEAEMYARRKLLEQ
jgi:lipase chaperone LimK